MLKHMKAKEERETMKSYHTVAIAITNTDQRYPNTSLQFMPQNQRFLESVHLI